MRELPPLRGEIWLVHTPGQPTDPHQPRPALVVSTDERNQLADDVTVVPLFSRGEIGLAPHGFPSGVGLVGWTTIP